MLVTPNNTVPHPCGLLDPLNALVRCSRNVPRRHQGQVCDIIQRLDTLTFGLNKLLMQGVVIWHCFIINMTNKNLTHNYLEDPLELTLH